MNWDPITRIIGNLGVYTKIDFANRVVTECHVVAVPRLLGVHERQGPRDAGFITSRICGVCRDNHTTCSVYAQNMAYGITPPPQAENIINLGEAAEYMFDRSSRTTWCSWTSVRPWSSRPTRAMLAARRTRRLPT